MTLKRELSKILISLCLVLVACESLPPKPEIVQYGVFPDVNPPGFYGVNNKTNQRVYRPFSDMRMKGGQCVDRRDYQELVDYAKTVEEIARARCK